MPRALLVHGLNSNPQNWWRVRGWLDDAGWMTRTATLLGHDGRGPAGSYALEAYVGDLLDREPGPWDLVIAHSLGASTATVAAASNSAWTARLVLLDPVWWIPAEDRAAVIADQVGELALTGHALRAAKPHWDPRDIEAKLAAIAVVEPDAAHRTFTETRTETADEWDLRAIADTLAVPTLVLRGDPAVYTMLQDGVAATNPKVETVIVPGAGHSPHRDRPDATHALLLPLIE
jgi:pimeloyl-ACP methyl ester carboxylesterase